MTGRPCSWLFLGAISCLSLHAVQERERPDPRRNMLILQGLPLVGRPGLPARAANVSTAQRNKADVPLSLRRGEIVQILPQRGVSFLDYDADGWVDLYLGLSAQLLRNQEGNGFKFVADLRPLLPVRPGSTRYNASCADYDADGLPDIASEPRNDCFYLLRNLGGEARFVEVASDPEIVLDRPPCTMQAETFCWADVDEDGDLDLFAPAYPDSASPGSGGNRFFENLGASGPQGAYRLALRTPESGLGNPPGTARPEGAQFVDIDRDGDLDAYSNGTLYQNVTAAAGPRFRALVGAPSGLMQFALLDEGALLFDADMDGDQDLFVVFFARSCRLYENRGDGTFRERTEELEQPELGAVLGCSAEDWDADGDLDLTAANVFRRNLLMESGEPFLRLATHSIPPTLSWLGGVSPAWADMDRDGDVDCVWTNNNYWGALLWNTTYTSETPDAERLSVRVRPVCDSRSVPRGLETEFGATVEVRVHGEPSERIRRRFTASSHGYLQQSEYALTFALPPGPDASQPARGVRFDLLVDFPSLAQRGILRIDRNVNPVLGGLDLAALAEREITVYRSGAVGIDGGIDDALIPPRRGVALRLESTGPLAVADADLPLAAPVPAPAPDWCVGLELDMSAAAGAVHIEELVLDGAMAPPGAGRCGANVGLWDVTPGTPPRRVQQERLETSARNARSFLPLSWKLEPGRRYRAVCRVIELRASPRLVPAAGVPRVDGALSFAHANPCDPAALLAAPLLSDQVFFELHRSLPADGKR